VLIRVRRADAQQGATATSPCSSAFSLHFGAAAFNVEHGHFCTIQLHGSVQLIKTELIRMFSKLV
jgi:hypothetical protein